MHKAWFMTSVPGLISSHSHRFSYIRTLCKSITSSCEVSLISPTPGGTDTLLFPVASQHHTYLLMKSITWYGKYSVKISVLSRVPQEQEPSRIQICVFSAPGIHSTMFIEYLLYTKHQGHNSESEGTRAVPTDPWPAVVTIRKSYTWKYNDQL